MKQLQSAREHYARQQRIVAAGLTAARRAWQAGDTTKLVAIVTLFQMLAARDAAASVQDMLEEQGTVPPAAGTVAVSALAGIASDGRPLESLLDLVQSPQQLSRILSTQLQDAARVSAGVGITARQRVGYVRMLEGGSCSRCVVLAGRWYRYSAGFDRHPNCDCRHIPARENVASDLTTNPDTYFRSLSKAEQDAKFGEVGAQAIRDGADISQVVNARSGMSSAGRTTAGTTRRGTFGHLERQRGGGFTGRNVGRRGAVANYVERRTQRARLMPEAIYQIAKDRDEAVRLLKLYGYLI